ncbi:hypothetical protein CK203_083360 [Vitis vinifera]|uniref:Uncharacterized protein n=1 Tax=Vitis vinifera TaxID=29760 RepID=A0A438BW04_VITVI|nr:hypothetical protein CK203_083360 [Vitis vinifera]
MSVCFSVTDRALEEEALRGESSPGMGVLITRHRRDWTEGGGIRRGPTPFRFENMCLKVEGFKDLVRTWWQGIEVRAVLVID